MAFSRYPYFEKVEMISKRCLGAKAWCHFPHTSKEVYVQCNAQQTTISYKGGFTAWMCFSNRKSPHPPLWETVLCRTKGPSHASGLRKKALFNVGMASCHTALKSKPKAGYFQGETFQQTCVYAKGKCPSIPSENEVCVENFLQGISPSWNRIAFQHLRGIMRNWRPFHSEIWICGEFHSQWIFASRR